jgi:hypothetical protein
MKNIFEYASLFHRFDQLPDEAMPASSSGSMQPPVLSGASTVTAPDQRQPMMSRNPYSGQPFSQRYYDILKKRYGLPVYEHKENFMNTLNKTQFLVLVGETGSGKTTQVSFHCRLFLRNSGFRKFKRLSLFTDIFSLESINGNRFPSIDWLIDCLQCLIFFLIWKLIGDFYS